MRLLILVFTSLIFGQLNSQTTDAELFFNDGTSIVGYGMIYQNHKIKFRLTLEDKPDLWTYLMVDKIVFYGFETSKEFQFIKLKPNKPPYLLEVLVDEETKLYANTIEFNSGDYLLHNPNGDFSNFNDIPLPFDSSYLKTGNKSWSYIKLYVKKENDEFPLALAGNFKRKAREYFSDCEMLVQKINKGEFRKSTATEMVYYYIDYCGE